ncbi:hypothetical protein [Coleofasciculus sp. H7-2]
MVNSDSLTEAIALLLMRKRSLCVKHPKSLTIKLSQCDVEAIQPE